MSDSTLNAFLARGSTADRTAFVPAPPTPATGADIAYLWWDTDELTLYSYDFVGPSWVNVTGSSSTFTLLTADPGAPSDDTWWVVRTGTSPTMTVALKFRFSGVTYTLASVTM